jgi:hypothetical protein
MALGCGLTSVRGNRGDNEPLVRQKYIRKNNYDIIIAIIKLFYVTRKVENVTTRE